MQNLRTEDFNYSLPKDRIAQRPLDKRDNSKLMVLNREDEKIIHSHFYDLKKFLKKGDLLVLNDTRVIPARLYCSRDGKTEKIEIFTLENLGNNIYRCLVKPGKKVKVGISLKFNDNLYAKCVNINEDGSRDIEFLGENIEDNLLKIGNIPLPPYIKEKLDNKERYQTIYSKNNGSVAAPTAGLHFTRDIIDDLQKNGINLAYLTLHVGLGTFKPVVEEFITQHKMHSERFIVNKETKESVNSAKKEGRRVIAVGTTSLRTLESISDEDGFIEDKSSSTDIFIYPGYKFKCVDALITNFHLPKSTLLMLVSAFSNRNFIMRAYEEAINEDYRFFSFGDCMFIE